MKAVYSNLKFLRFKEQLDALENGHMVSPVHIRIKPINACNHDCWYCAYHVDDLQLGKMMEMNDVIPRGKMMEIIDDLGDMGVKAVTFSGGGEPTIYPHLEESINRLGQKEIKVASLTNGSGLKGAVAETFARYGTWVRISFDGWDSESYAKFRNVKLGEFDKVIRNMRDFAGLKSACVLGTSYIVGQKNYEHVFDFVSLMKDTGVNHVKITGLVVSNNGLENKQYHDGIREEVREQIDRAKLLEDDTLKIVNHYHEMSERFGKEYTTCPSQQFLIVIGANNKVYSCQDKAYTNEGLLGSIENKRFKEFWFSEENYNRIMSINPSVDCTHHCSAHQKNLLSHEYLAVDENHVEFI